jgi:hypothetical protein
MMTADNIVIVIMALGSAGVFLALVIGIGDGDVSDLASGIANMTPAARRKAKFDTLDDMIRTADEGIAARTVRK